MASSQTHSLHTKEAVIDLFDHFREELDEQNDRRERLIKSSRDITNLSKRCIFLLHRVATEDTKEDLETRALRAAKQGWGKLRDIQRIFASMKCELEGDLYWRHQKSVSPGLQEYIEALSFAHYLEHETLISYQAVQQTLCDEAGTPYFPLTISDYLLGLSDLTGELMRYAISAISRKGGRAKASDICAFVRHCKADFEGMCPRVRGLSKKQSVTNQSLQKIEDAAYTIAVRSSEYDLPSDILDDIVARSISGYDNSHSNYDRKPERWRDRDGSGDEDEYY
ncbi:Translin [Gloeophyllum trabeum ATCC 11539]|uniref:Translin n=1 Tax=Gloeophyllum trabeum (strain ATCC 11539 / FP-39264 / Madison 617) TaxID=670483 RepID=S7QN38_GLOTA|nr:Translin [Gloeophyllum trabeum ATCC 11539]EPQ60971.1 Translin [Gloeophyllum trabeum ATCC 11539]